jgi:hypothetical protein
MEEFSTLSLNSLLQAQSLSINDVPCLASARIKLGNGERPTKSDEVVVRLLNVR